MRNLNRMVSIILLILGVLVIWEISGIHAIGNYGPGPKLMPTVLGIILIILSIVNFVLGERKIGKGQSVFNENIGKVLVVVVTFFLYFLGVKWLGFTISNFIFLIILMGVIEKMETVKAFVMSISFTILFHLMFDVWLQVNVPQGLLEKLFS